MDRRCFLGMVGGVVMAPAATKVGMRGGKFERGLLRSTRFELDNESAGISVEPDLVPAAIRVLLAEAAASQSVVIEYPISLLQRNLHLPFSKASQLVAELDRLDVLWRRGASYQLLLPASSRAAAVPGYLPLNL